jgi:hypothetical protein
MGVTRLIVDLTEICTGQAGSLGDIAGLVDLLCNHVEAMDGLEEAGSNNSNSTAPPEISSDDSSAPAEQAAEHLPQVSHPQPDVIWSSFHSSISRNRSSALKREKNARAHRQWWTSHPPNE